MDITYTAKDNVKIISKNTTIWINPSSVNRSDVSLCSQPNKSNNQDKLCFDSPGEYEVNGVMLDGVGLDSTNTAWTVLGEGIKVAYADGEFKELDDKQVEVFGGVDVLIVALDNQSGEAVVKFMNQLEPKVVVPIDYTEQALQAFIKEVGSEPEKIERLKINRRDLDEANQRIVVLQ